MGEWIFDKDNELLTYFYLKILRNPEYKRVIIPMSKELTLLIP